MFIYILLISYFSITLGIRDIMSILWDEEDVPVKRVLYGNLTSPELHDTLIRRLSQVPFISTLKSDAWYKILEDRHISTLTLRDWKYLSSLIPYLPPDMLRNVNFSDEKVIEYFGRLQLKQRQFSLLAEILMAESKDILQNEEKIMIFGSIFCGLSNKILNNLNTKTFRALLENKFFNSMKDCSIDKLKLLCQKAQSYDIVGPPRTWTPKTVMMMGSLLAGLEATQIRQVRSRTFTYISAKVIELIPSNVLSHLRIKQILALNRSSLLAWRRKTKNLKMLNFAPQSPSIVFIQILSYTCILLVKKFWS